MFFPTLMAVLVILLTVWTFYSLSTGNPLWFQPVPERTYVPERIIVHYYGTTSSLDRSSEAFGEINMALNQSLSDFRGRIPIGLSEETVRDFREKDFVLEVYFSNDIGSVIGLDQPLNQLLIPIDGRHSNNRYLFVGNNNEWLATALIIAEPQPLFTALDDLGYPVKN